MFIITAALYSVLTGGSVGEWPAFEMRWVPEWNEVALKQKFSIEKWLRRQQQQGAGEGKVFRCDNICKCAWELNSKT